MNGKSLRLRLLAGAALAVFAALLVSWLVLGFLFERHVERRVEADLTARGRDLIAALTVTPEGLSVGAFSDPRFATPAGGYYWQVSGGATDLRSRSLWDEALPAASASAAAWRTAEISGPFDQDLIVVTREIRLEAGGPVLRVTLAEDHAHVTQARDEFARDLALFLLVLWVVLAAAAWLQVRLGLKPLEDVRDALSGLRSKASARLQEESYPIEAAPLAHAINALADARERDLELARRRAGDLAHSLKTPLTALAAQSRRARDAGAADAADGLDRAIEAVRRVVERELARTRAASAAGGACDGRAAMSKLIQVIERTGADVVFENTVAASPYPVSEDVLMEIAGPLLENASRYGRAQVRVSGDGAVLAIEDDGPGLSDAEAEAALARGKRLDESGDGHGLGLAIAREMAEAAGAELTLTRAALGGLRAEVRWPPK